MHEERRMRNEPSLAPFIRTSADVLDCLPVWQNSNGSRSIFAGAVDKQSCLSDGSRYQREPGFCANFERTESTNIARVACWVIYENHRLSKLWLVGL
jgi:hypothetical protein